MRRTCAMVAGTLACPEVCRKAASAPGPRAADTMGATHQLGWVAPKQQIVSWG